MSNNELITALKNILGQEKVATDEKKTEYYRKGFRAGSGGALAVLFPDSLLTLWQVLKVCVEANTVIIMQAANTGLTAGSVPNNDDYDREVVIINTLRINNIVLLNGGEQVLGFAGATLHALEKKLKPLKRAPHSVIGSSSIGASIVGGVSNNSGGSLVKRGPAYTELALYARVNEKGELELVNHLGIDLGDSADATPEEIIARLERQDFSTDDLDDGGKLASDREYVERIRDIDAVTPARFNADKRRLFEASGCAGKLAVFAVRLDTFEVAKQEQTFYIGTNDAQVLTKLRRHILSEFENVPDVGEYLHGDMFDIGEKYGKDTFLTIQHLGTDSLPKMFAWKGRIDATLNKIPLLPKFLTDHVMQFASHFWPKHLPKRMIQFRDKYEHHLILKMSDEGIAEAQSFLTDFFASNNSDGLANDGDFFVCTDDEASKAMLLRFAAAGAAIRYQTVKSHKVGDILALDIALRRNDMNWVENLPREISDQIDSALYYGHFMCHVFHQDYILKKGADTEAVKKAMLAVLDERGAKYPAEHNVGHLYEAEQDLKSFYRELDPTNTFNPGIGKMSKHKRNCSCCL
ncbi:D-lactate dehydrogenase [Cocleimonas flava]|uniref:Quinone-dependent D-lactate dehydrogenase n=1 Tax=Cocleimonas flava TaxID=634765 RepID=A0A4R1F0V3_9GAMM|nr:D-lactate dehydrogenase [Cocleimonas flava]TCJ87867.1 D-lactate dehydrogenase [Cocleimonas flava]